jgi:2-oxo-4-hydroxy-4-carboxy-5-ureidoimidazoline decarboxylase
LADLNGRSLLTFTEALLPLYGNAGWVAALAYAQRPFADVNHLHRAMADIVASADPSTKEQIIALQADPFAPGGIVPPLDADEKAALQKLQVEYLKKFGFPLVVATSGLAPAERAQLVASVEGRLANSREQEVTNSLDEVAKIARTRLGELISA